MRTALITGTMALCLSVVDSAEAGYIGGLDLVSNSSIFEVSQQVLLPALGWSNVAGTARMWDNEAAGPRNGMLIGTSDYGNYEVQYLTGVTIQPNTQYTLNFNLGFAADAVGGVADYRFQLGTVDGSLVFTPLGPAKVGTVNYAGNMELGVVSGSDNLVFTTGAAVLGDPLAVRWAQTGTRGTPFSQSFGFDNVSLDATAVPEPSSLISAALGLAGLVGYAGWKRVRLRRH